jgi:peptide/nickel transport system permease protein
VRFVYYLAGRAIKAFLVVIGVAILSFVLIRLAPGDPAIVMAGEAGAADEAFLSQLREEFGLDKPLPTQLGLYLKQMASLDLGYSYRQRQPVFNLIAERFPATLLLTGVAFIAALLMGVTLGYIAARNRGRWQDTAVTCVAIICYATPVFWVGMLFVLLFSVQLDWLPAFGMESIGANLTGLSRAGDILRHLILPATTLALFYAAAYARMTRAAMLEVYNLDFVKTARAKGIPEGLVQRRHVFRNAMLPILTLAGIQAGQLVGGSIVVETVFSWPGIGRLAFEALVGRDYSVLLGVFLLAAVMVVVINLITDLAYGLVDPRIGFGS